MNESIKATLGVIVAALVLAALIAWMPSMTNEAVSPVKLCIRIGGPILAVVCLAPLVWAQTRKDKVPNFLARITPRYFERDGFCFAIVPRVQSGNCTMEIYFQNRYDQPCSANILVRASSGLFSGKADLSDLTLGVSCSPAEFGCSTIPWAIPGNLQGKAVSLSLYAGVKYPNGRGKLLRYKDGLRVGSVGMDFWREGLQIAGAIGGGVVISRPARIKFTLPSGVSAEKREVVSAETKTIWKLGDQIS
jgi:hypothetical protein